MFKEEFNKITILNLTIHISQITSAQKLKKSKPKQSSKDENNLESYKASNKAEKMTAQKSSAKIKRASRKDRKLVPKKKLVRKSKPKKKPIPKKTKKDKENQVPDELKWLQEDPHDQLLSRFVETPKGTTVGESIGIEKSKLILKYKLKFYVIPLKYVKEKDDKLVLRRKVDWTRAAKLGEVWRKKALDVIPKNKPKKSKTRGVK